MKYTLALIVTLTLVLGGGYYWHTKTAVAPDTAYVAATTTDGSYTAAQVAAHNTAQDCWTIVSGSIYNLTEWIAQHPGGEGPILSICGNDGTSAFMDEHMRDSRAQGMLATFKIGTLTP